MQLEQGIVHDGENLLKQSQQAFKIGQYETAIVLAEKFLQDNRSDCTAQYIQAMCWMHLDEYEKSRACIEKIKSVNADYIGAYMAEVYIYKKQGRFITEIELLQKIILHIGRLQKKEGTDCYANSLSEAWSLLGSAYIITGQAKESADAFFKASRLERSETQKIKEYSNALFVINYIPDLKVKELKEYHKGFQKFFSGCSHFPHFPERKKRLRIAYISPDFRQHPVAYFILPLLRSFNREKFEVYCYAANEADEITLKLQPLVSQWRNIYQKEPAAVAREIYEDHIDILVDLSGHTKGNCLPVLAYKPAPVQVTGIGYFNTTGLKAVDYILTDGYCDPEGAEKEFTEKLIRLPQSHFCYSPLQEMPEVKNTPGKENGFITFGCFNNFNKVTDAMLLIWWQIMQKVDNARLILKSKIFSSEEGRMLVKLRLGRLGFAVERVELRPFSKDYLEQYKDIDIALDTFPYTGGATTCEALYMGVPVITLCGHRHGARFGYSLLKNAGLPEFIAMNEREYMEKAVLLSGDIELLNGLHNNLRQILKVSSLMDEAKYVEAVEAAYRRIWEEKVAEESAVMMKPSEYGVTREHVFSCIRMGDYRQAEVLTKKLLQVSPEDRELLGALLGLYIETYQPEKAHPVLDTLRKLYPSDSYSMFLEARVDYLENKWVSVIRKSKYALTHGKELTDEIKGKIYNIMGSAYKECGEAANNLDSYLAASRYSLTMEGRAAEYSNYLFNLHYLPVVSGSKMYREHEKYNQFFKKGIIPYNHQPRSRAKIRIGYISPDLRQHVVTFFSYTLFKHYDHALFEVICYARCREDAVSEQIKRHVDGWRNIQDLAPEEAAACIFADEIDVLFDLSGHTRNNCLPIMAYKPAPIQISGIGYFDTTGLKTIDYFLGDIYTDQPGEPENRFSEKILRLPHSHFCYVPPDTMPVCKEAAFEKNKYITFGSFNNFSKTTEAMLLLWKKILENVPGSRLLLKSKIFGSQEGRTLVIKRLQQAGFDLDYVEMRPESSNYLLEYGDVDIALDTYPYPGGGTTCEALYMGVPVITLVGRRHGTRFGYSLLKNVGLDDCCAFSEEEYVEKAVRLAADKHRLAGFHTGLREQMQNSHLMNGSEYMQNLEKEYLKIVQPYFEQKLFINNDALPQHLNNLFAAQQWQGVIQICAQSSVGGRLTAENFSLWAQAYFKTGDYLRGINVSKQALAEGLCKKDHAFFVRLGTACKKNLDYLDAEEYFSTAITCIEEKKIQPDQNVLSELKLEQAQLSVWLGKTEQAAELYYQVSDEHSLPERRWAAYSSYLLSLHYRSRDEAWLYKEHCRYDTFFKGVIQYQHVRKLSHRKVRIGYLSPDFRQHVMFYFCYVLLHQYNRNLFEIYCYSLTKTADAFTTCLKPKVTVWRDVSSWSDKEIARVIYKDEVDILVDLAGHSAGTGLSVLALKPAPIQVSGLGYVNTTGLSSVDYFFADPYTDAAGTAEAFFSEKLLHLPQSQFCYTGRSDVSALREAPCKKIGYITFGCFNNFAKITDACLALWLEILNRVEDARLYLKSQVFVSTQVVTKAKERLQAIGYDLNRVLFAPATSDYMEQYLSIDIALDTYPYPGGGTTCDALYMGVPVISMYGAGYGSRFGFSILKNAGIEELAVQTENEYIEKAVSLANDWALLDMLHCNLRDIILASPLMNQKLYMEQLEKIYMDIYIAKQNKGEI